LDVFALHLVEHAANDQGLIKDHSSTLATQRFDLVHDNVSSLPKVDLYLMADVFESSRVAIGAARLTKEILQKDGATVWVFAQSDRAQREVYLQELQTLLLDTSIAWQAMEQGPSNKLWLCDVDETTVKYG
jgi:hypothetical protein